MCRCCHVFGATNSVSVAHCQMHLAACTLFQSVSLLTCFSRYVSVSVVHSRNTFSSTKFSSIHPHAREGGEEPSHCNAEYYRLLTWGSLRRTVPSESFLRCPATAFLVVDGATIEGAVSYSCVEKADSLVSPSATGAKPTRNSCTRLSASSTSNDAEICISVCLQC